MNEVGAAALLFLFGFLCWAPVLAIVLACEHHQLAPARSGGGTSSTAGFGPDRSPALPTPRLPG